MINSQADRAIVNPNIGVDGKLDEFCTAFADVGEIVTKSYGPLGVF